MAQHVQKMQLLQPYSYASGNNNLHHDKATNDSIVLKGLNQLRSTARSVAQFVEAGRWLKKATLLHQQLVAVVERIVRATALTGLLQLSVRLVDQYFAETPPPMPCQDALAQGLRQAGRVSTLERLLRQWASQSQQRPEAAYCVSPIAFNTYLAALWDIYTDRDIAASQRSETSAPAQSYIAQISATNGSFPFYNRSPPASDTATAETYKELILQRACHWLLQDEACTAQQMGVRPDTVAYATVLQAAAASTNHSLVEELWQAMTHRNVRPNIVAYNARLKSLNSQWNQTFGDAAILHIWDKEIVHGRSVQPDKYTIDSLLLPLLRAGRIGDLEALLDTLVQRNSETVVSQAFVAFLQTVVAGNEVASARALFETYILPTLSPVVMGDAGGMVRLVRPATRHFNTLLEGYRKQRMENLDADAEEAWNLYRLMLSQGRVRPDAYTITIMMGLCRNSTELSELLVEAALASDLNISISSVVLRAACT